MVKRSQRLVALFAAVIIFFEVAAVPQKAKAVAITASVVASVAAIMTACGVTYWAASQTDAIEYLGGKIDEYLGTLETVPQSYEDWLGINASSELFDVPTAGVMRFTSGIANKVLDFVRWFTEDEGVVSGGAAVVENDFNQPLASVGSPPQGSISASFYNSNTILLVYDACKDVNSGYDYGFTVGLPAENVRLYVAFAEYGRYAFNTARRFSVSVADNQSSYLDMGQGSYIDISGNVGDVVSILANLGTAVCNANFRLEFQGISFEEEKVRVTPSDTVSVPDEFSEEESFDVAPSVSLTQGMTVEQASDALLAGVASEDGLTSDGDAVDTPSSPSSPSLDLAGILEALGSILNAIISIPSHIANGVQSIVTTLGQKVDAFKDAVHGFLTSFNSYLYDIQQRVTEMAHDVTMLISDRLEYLFVPDEIYVQNYVQSIMHLFDGRVGILTFPLSVFVDFLTRFSSIADGDHSFHWGDINEPFSGKQVIAAGSYDLDDAVAASPMSTVYSIYLVVVKAIIAFWFLRLCQRKYELIVNGH